jgi:hypothetical protein
VKTLRWQSALPKNIVLLTYSLVIVAAVFGMPRAAHAGGAGALATCCNQEIMCNCGGDMICCSAEDLGANPCDTENDQLDYCRYTCDTR